MIDADKLPPVSALPDEQRVGLFVGSGYRILTTEQARALADLLRAAADTVDAVVRSTASAAALIALALLAGCATPPPRVVTKSVAVEVPVYTRVPLPADLLQSCRVIEPDPACWRDGQREYCNGQLVSVRDDYRAALALCDARMTRLRSLDAEGATP